MKFKIAPAALNEVIKKVLPAVPSKPTVVILANAKMVAEKDKLNLTTTNLDMTLCASADCDSVTEPGETTVPVKMLAQIVSKLTDDVEIAVDGRNRMTVKSGACSFKVGCLPVDDFPKICPNEKSDGKFTLPAKDVLRLLRQTSFAMCQDDTRKTLKSVLVDFPDKGECLAVATDGRRLAKSSVETKSGGKATMIIPSESVFALMKFLPPDGNVTITRMKSQTSFTTDVGSEVFYTKLADAVYPNYNAVIPTNRTSEVTVGREDLISAIDRVSIMVSSEHPAIKMSVRPSTIRLSISGDNDSGASEEIPVKYDGDDIDLSFNPRYLLEPLGVIDDDNAVIRFAGVGPVTIVGEGEKTAEHPATLFVVMPMRVG